MATDKLLRVDGPPSTSLLHIGVDTYRGWKNIHQLRMRFNDDKKMVGLSPTNCGTRAADVLDNFLAGFTRDSLNILVLLQLL